MPYTQWSIQNDPIYTKALKPYFTAPKVQKQQNTLSITPNTVNHKNSCKRNLKLRSNSRRTKMVQYMMHVDKNDFNLVFQPPNHRL